MFITDQNGFGLALFYFEQPFGRKQSQRAWGSLSLNMSFDELCLIISFIECRSL